MSHQEKNRVLRNCKCMKNVSCLVPRFADGIFAELRSIDLLSLIRVKRSFYRLGLSTRFSD